MRDRETRHERAVSSSECDPSSSNERVEKPNGSGGRRETPIWLIGFLGLAIGLAVTLRIMQPYGFDPAIFVGFGRDDRPSQSSYVRALLGEDVTIRRNFAHDGKFFFAQANDPWYLEPEVHAVVLDRPIYRAQRMLFPVLAGGFGLFPPNVVVWSMLVTNLLALTIGAILAAKLAQAWGASTLLGLWVPLNVGLLFELDIGGAGIVAYTCCLGATYALVEGRTWLASALFAAAALSKEYMIAFAIGVFILVWLEERRRLWRLLVVPAVALGAWGTYIWVRLDGIRGVGAGGSLVTPFDGPFKGLVEALGWWSLDPVHLLVNLVIVSIIAVFVPLAFRSRMPLAWGALPIVAMSVFLSVDVWRETFDLVRLMAPVFTAVPFLVATSALRSRVAGGSQPPPPLVGSLPEASAPDRGRADG